MTTAPNKITGANAGRPRLLPILAPWAARIAHLCRSPKYVGGPAKLKSLEGRHDNSPGQAQRRPGLRVQNDSLFFSSGLARFRRAKPEALYPGPRPRRPCPGLLSCCPSGAPDRRTSRASQRQEMAFLLPQSQRPGVAALSARSRRISWWTILSVLKSSLVTAGHLPEVRSAECGILGSTGTVARVLHSAPLGDTGLLLLAPSLRPALGLQEAAGGAGSGLVHGFGGLAGGSR